MPARTNRFQSIITEVYKIIAPFGATVKESALVDERDGGKREIDILIEYDMCGHRVRLAIECRDRNRKETKDWIDSLIGKYQDLHVDKIVAISSSGFASSVIKKARSHGIDTINVTEAENVDWANKLKITALRGMTQTLHLMLLAGYHNGREITFTRIDENNCATHKDDISEKLFSSVSKYFYDYASSDVERQILNKIGEKWQYYFDNPTPRWAEFYVESNLYFETPFGNIHFDKFVFGVSTKFHFSDLNAEDKVMNNHMFSTIKLSSIFGSEGELLIVKKPSGEISGITLINKEEN